MDLASPPDRSQVAEAKMLSSLYATSKRSSFRRSFIAAIGLVDVVLAGAAGAADLGIPVKAPPPLPIYSWTGSYLGGAVGYAWGRDTTTE